MEEKELGGAGIATTERDESAELSQENGSSRGKLTDLDVAKKMINRVQMLETLNLIYHLLH